jgi:hypothetical protein
MRPVWLLGIVAILSASPAAADITARYASPINNAVTITVEVNDRGDSRVSMGNQMAFLTVGGVAYVLGSDLSGVYAVTEEDWIAVQTANMRAALPADFGKSPELPAYEVIEGGTETVADRTGKVWWLRVKGEPTPTAGARPSGFDFVVNGDPDLAPVGRALARQMGASSAMMGAITEVARDFVMGNDEIFAKGTVIRMSRVMRLDSVDTNPVPASAFALPATVLTREQFAARSGSR